MRPEMTAVNIPANVSAFTSAGKRHIRAEVDVKFRKALREAVKTDGGATAVFHICNALANGPSRGGATEAMKYFGSELDLKLALTAEIVDALEISVPGFKKWLNLTGFGNDKTMIKGFVAWAEYKSGRGRVMTRLND
jgi:hypothetical protein